MANPPFNVDKVKAESAENAGRLPFGMPSVNDKKEVSNANYLWISYFYSYLKEGGRAGFVMAASATDSQYKDKDIRESLVKTGHMDVIISVANKFFYTSKKSLPCSLWFIDKGKKDNIKNKVLFIDARNYYTEVDKTRNEWSEWQLKNINAIVWLYRGEIEKYKELINEYKDRIYEYVSESTDKELDDILIQYNDFGALKCLLKEHIVAKRKYAKECIDACENRKKKAEQIKWDEYLLWLDEILSVVKEASIQEQMRQQQLQQFHNNQMLKTFECVHKLEDFLKSADELAPQYRDIAAVQCLILLDEYFKRQRMM